MNPAVDVDDHHWLKVACDLARLCPPTMTAFAVGAVIVSADGEEIAQGYSRETDAHVHAEESVLGKVDPRDPRLRAATLYSSLEPCSKRRSRPMTCTELILASGIPRVVFAWREPLHFTDCQGAEELRAAGVTVREIPDLADLARQANAHLLA
jgi:diaminohydroxyphosphoribosylaminopyrimidine deaminase/5-amino-6-(5-phosphoribosylamino)uracil reductase